MLKLLCSFISINLLVEQNNYYQVPALNPYNFDFDAPFLPKPTNDSLPNSSSLSLSLLSQYPISNAASNLPAASSSTQAQGDVDFELPRGRLEYGD